MQSNVAAGQMPSGGVVGKAELAATISTVEQPCQERPGRRCLQGILILCGTVSTTFDDLQTFVVPGFVNDDQVFKGL